MPASTRAARSRSPKLVGQVVRLVRKTLHQSGNLRRGIDSQFVSRRAADANRQRPQRVDRRLSRLAADNTFRAFRNSVCCSRGTSLATGAQPLEIPVLIDVDRATVAHDYVEVVRRYAVR